MLVVDDEHAMAQLVADGLAKRGHTVRTAHDAATALAIARELDPHVVLLDLHLAGDDSEGGHELGLALRRQARRPLQLVVLTGDERFTAHARTEALGFAAHLVKPVPMRDLERLIELLLPWARGSHA